MSNSKMLRPKIINAAKETLEMSTIHAIPNITKNKYILVKLFWVVCFMASFGVCLWYIISSIKEFFSYEAVSNQNIEYTNEMIMPVINICNLNKFNYAEIEYNILLCRFKGINCNLNNDFEQFIDPYYGICYRFNSGRTMNGSQTSLKYTNLNNAITPYPLELIIYVGCNRSDVFTSGLNIFLSDQTVNSSQSGGINIAPGISTKIVVDKYKLTKKPNPYSDCIGDLTSVDAYPSQCYKKAFSLLINKYYQFTDCKKMCFSKIIGDYCNCQVPEDNVYQYGLIYYQNLTNDCNNKSSIHHECYQSTEMAFHSDSKLLDSCDCPRECETSSYTYSTSIAQFPGNIESIDNRINLKQINKDFFYKVFPNESNRTLLNYKINLARMTIGYNELKVTTIIQDAKISPSDLVANIGGILGLFLGLSFLSFAEFAEIIIQTIIIYLKRKFMNKNEIHNPNESV